MKTGGLFMKVLWLTAPLILLISACTPTVQLEAPDKPITINMNVKIDHEIRVKVDKEVDQLFNQNNDLF